MNRRCKHSKECEAFQVRGVTCNDYTAEGGFCGQYKEFEKFRGL